MKINWIKIAPTPTDTKPIIPNNTIRRLTIDKKKLFLAHINQQYFVGENRCPHAGAPLHTGQINDCGHLVCPYHRYTFDPENGQNSSGEGLFLQTYPVEVRVDGVYVGLPQKKWFGLF